MRGDGRFQLGILGLVAIVALALVGPFLPHDPGAQYTDLPTGPSVEFWLGTDHLGRDELSRLASAASMSLFVGAAGSLLATAIGTLVGAAAGSGDLWIGLSRDRRVRLPVEGILMRTADAMLAFPAILLAFALAALIGEGVAVVVFVIAVTCWTGPARIVYGRVRSVRRSSFVEAAHAAGVGDLRILVRHVLPHVLPVALVYTALGFANAVLLEAALSYLGVGVGVQEASWGRMIYDNQQAFDPQPLLLALPGLAILLTVLSLLFVADSVADALDPATWTRAPADPARWRLAAASFTGGRT